MDYSAKAIAARKTLIKFGKALTFSRNTAGPYDPALGAATVTESTWVQVAVVLPSVGTQSSDDNKFKEGLLVRSNTREMLIAAEAGKEIEAGDKVTFEGGEWTVVGTSPLAPAGEVVIFSATVMR